MPTTSILPGMGNTRGILTPMVPFNVIVETDVGLLSLIYKEYLDEDVFDPEYFKGKTVRQMVRDLCLRKENNPLTLCIREDYLDMADTFYDQFMEREYDKIIDMSAVTEMYRVVGSFSIDGEIKTTIVCKEDIERDTLMSMEGTKRCDFVMVDSLNANDITKFNQLYFKYLDDAIPFAKYLKGKSIYIANYGFNKDEYGRLKYDEDSIVSLLAYHNDVMLMDIFNMGKLLEGDQEDG